MSQKLEWIKKVKELSKKISEIKTENGEQSKEAPVKFSPAEASLLQNIIRKCLIESENEIEIEQKDPNSPLFSFKSFEAFSLKPELLGGIYAMGFKTPSKFQETTLSTLLANPPQNIIAQSPYGTGKTVALVLAMLSRVDPEKNYPQVLCLSPTYELAIQTGEILARMGQFCPEIICKIVVRDEEVPQNSKLTDHIIIGTPGKVLVWGVEYQLFDLSKISVFVLDEADVMISTQGHQDQIIEIHKCLSKKCQMVSFSATYNNGVMKFAEVIVKNPLIIRLHREQESLDNIKQYFVKCGNEQEKYMAITNIYGVLGVGQCIIFCRTRRNAKWLAEKMSKDGHAVALLTGELTVEQRISVLDRFRTSQEKVLITTNVLSRGINFEQVTIVVNFDLPVDTNAKADCETYLFRISRGRFGNSGVAINLIDCEESMQVCKDIEAHFGIKIHPLNTDDCDEIKKIGF